MISDKHKCIYMHITKCAGSSVESAFGIDVRDNSNKFNYQHFGWNDHEKMYMQHATPKILLDKGLIDRRRWEEYYKFIIVRNPWERMYSDYVWFVERNYITGSFTDYLYKRNRFKRTLSDAGSKKYRGDHLKKQIEYFFINDEEISYDTVIRMENIDIGLKKVCNDLSLHSKFFERREQVSNTKKIHYSLFYNKKRMKMIQDIYRDDILYLKYKFEDKKNIFQKIVSNLPSKLIVKYLKG